MDLPLSSRDIIKELSDFAQARSDFVLYRFVDYKNDSFFYEDCTVKAVCKKSLELAHALKNKGLQKGDVAVIFSMQDFGTIYAILGCIMVGVTFTVIPPPIDESKIDRFVSVVKSCHPNALISNCELEKGSNSSAGKKLLSGALFDAIKMKRIYTDKLVPNADESIIIDHSPDDLVYLQYTSGSTSAPKGVRILMRNLMSQLEQCADVYDFSNSKLATWVPFFHNLGLVITILMPICAHGAVIYHIPTNLFMSNPKIWIRLMSDEKINLTVGPGSAYEIETRIFTERESEEIDLSHTTHLMNGSELVSPKTIRTFAEKFKAPLAASAPGYGLAECVCLASVAAEDYRVLKLDPEKFYRRKAVLSDSEDAKEIVSLGRPVKGLTILAVNTKTHTALPEMEIGEICIQGPTVADGYWGNISENRNFRFTVKDHPGFFYRTGDLGFLHEGRLYITGRRGEMLIINGHNVYPHDMLLQLERAIPTINTSAIAFFSHNVDGCEKPVMCIESTGNTSFSRIASRINSVIANQFGFSFHDIIFVPVKSMPRTDNGKIKTSVKIAEVFSYHYF